MKNIKKAKIKNIEFPYFSEEIKTILILKGKLNTVNDLTLLTMNDILSLFDNNIEAYLTIRIFLHSNGLKFKNEYQNIDLPEETANIKIKDLGLPLTIKNIILRSGTIHTFGELLTTDYKYLSNLRGMGPKNIEIVRKYVHSLGFTLLNEGIILEKNISENQNNLSKPNEHIPNYNELLREKEILLARISEINKLLDIERNASDTNKKLAKTRK